VTITALINTEGTRRYNGDIEDTDVQVLYGRLIAPFWDIQEEYGTSGPSRMRRPAVPPGSGYRDWRRRGSQFRQRLSSAIKAKSLRARKLTTTS